MPIVGTSYPEKHTIVFDLDETLVHCEDAKKKGDEIITIILPNGRKIEVGTIHPDCDLHKTVRSRDLAGVGFSL